MRRTRTALLSALGVAALVLSACGASEEATAGSPTTTALPASSAPSSNQDQPHWLGESLMIECKGPPETRLPSDADFAFSGTVTAVEAAPVPTEQDDTPSGRWTFAVDEWFTADGPGEITVDLMWGAEMVTDEGGSQYRLCVGDRLLISGERDDSAPEWSGLAAGLCGGSGTYAESTAARWRQAFDTASG